MTSILDNEQTWLNAIPNQTISDEVMEKIRKKELIWTVVPEEEIGGKRKCFFHR